MTYEVGECVSKNCRTPDANETDTDHCRESAHSCCIPTESEMKMLNCTGYEMQVIVVKECGCGSCIAAPVKLIGQAVSAENKMSLEYVDVLLNGEVVAYSDARIRFFVDLSKSVDKEVITLKDPFKRGYLDATKIIDMPDGLSGSISLTIRMIKAAPPVVIDPKQKSVLNAVTSKNEQSQADTKPAAQIAIPADAFVKKDGSKFSVFHPD